MGQVQAVASRELNYCGELKAAMERIAVNPRAVFIGQGVGSPSTAQTDSFRDIPESRRIEFPVAEDLQLGFAIGLSLDGWLPVCVYPRWNFLLLAANQLVNHLDKIATYSAGGYNPKVIIRVAAPSTHPFDPGPQHEDDFSEPFAMMLERVVVRRLKGPEHVGPAYERAMARPGSTVLVEYSALYDAIPSGVMG